VENSPYGIRRGGEVNLGMTWQPFATMLERADILEAAGLNWAHPKFLVKNFFAELLRWRKTTGDELDFKTPYPELL